MAARFKGRLGQSCNISDVTWRNITVKDVSYPIHFVENYWDQGKGKPTGSDEETAAFAKRFTYDGIRGSVARMVGDGSCVSGPCWYATAGKFLLGSFLWEHWNWRFRSKVQEYRYLTREQVNRRIMDSISFAKMKSIVRTSTSRVLI